MAELKQLGKYQVLEVLGKGAMGVVYKGFDPIIERSVALKTIRKELIDQQLAKEIVARFKNEAQAAGRLTHPGIVAIYDYGEDADAAFIAMEFVPGRSLSERLAQRELFSLQTTIGLMGELLDALDYAHENGVVHRDIKPANLIVTARGRLKVADFGIARIDCSNLTMVGSVMGTPNYMSPEQYAGQVVDRRSDIFSCGVVLYELLTGRKPFDGSADTVAYKICHEPHRHPSELKPPGLPQAFDDLLAKALAKKPDDRFATAREFAAAVQAAFAQCTSSAAGADGTLLDGIAQEPEMAAPLVAPMVAPGPPVQDAGTDVKDLRALEELFAPYVGPIAKILLKKAAASARDGPHLVGLMADSISGLPEKKAFIAMALALLPSSIATTDMSSPGQTGTGSEHSALSPADVEAAAGLLLPYLGPIARIVAKKSAARTGDLKALYMSLAENIPDANARRKFLQSAGYS